MWIAFLLFYIPPRSVDLELDDKTEITYRGCGDYICSELNSDTSVIHIQPFTLMFCLGSERHQRHHFFMTLRLIYFMTFSKLVVNKTSSFKTKCYYAVARVF